MTRRLETERLQSEPHDLRPDPRPGPRDLRLREAQKRPAVLSWVKTLRYQEKDLARAFFSTRYTRILDGLSYLTLQRFRLYAKEGLAGTEVAVWVQEDSLTVEYSGEAAAGLVSSRGGYLAALPDGAFPVSFVTAMCLRLYGAVCCEYAFIRP